MEEIPQELFELTDKKREYKYINLNGKEEFVILNPGDRLINKRCQLDGAYFVAYSGDPHTVLECPACHKHGFGTEINSQKDIFDRVIPYAKFRIEGLKEELNHLETILKLAQNSDNEIKKANMENSSYNKANLSARQ
ncbi:MAG: hypothetical protein ACP5NZ_04075 [Nanobdellota archaeon]